MRDTVINSSCESAHAVLNSLLTFLLLSHYTERGLSCWQGHKAVILRDSVFSWDTCKYVIKLSLLAYSSWSFRSVALELKCLGTYLKIHKAEPTSAM